MRLQTLVSRPMSFKSRTTRLLVIIQAVSLIWHSRISYSPFIASIGGHVSNHQAHPYHPASSNDQRSGIDRRAPGDFMLLTKHRNWLPCAVPEYQEAYPRRMSRCSIVSPISSEPDDWVVVNANLPGSDSHA
ncbi:hypothetical protein ACGC1H_006539 [Rhizoctonia solani]